MYKLSWVSRKFLKILFTWSYILCIRLAESANLLFESKAVGGGWKSYSGLVYVISNPVGQE